MQEKLGLILEKEDEMECLVGGCNFLLKAIRHEAFTYENGSLNFVTNTGKCLLLYGLIVFCMIHTTGVVPCGNETHLSSSISAGWCCCWRC